MVQFDLSLVPLRGKRSTIQGINATMGLNINSKHLGMVMRIGLVSTVDLYLKRKYFHLLLFLIQ